MASNHSIVPLNETTALVSFGDNIDLDVNERIIALHHTVTNNPFQGFVESAPAYSSLAVFFRLPIRFGTVKKILETHIKSSESLESHGSAIEVPVLYDGDDLDVVAQQHQLSREEVISIHAAKLYRVFMLGFLPGFPYMGTVDQRIATARKNSPRTLVPAGSVGIAGIQTGIYPQSSPGGWQLIGRTPLKIFNAKKELPCLLKPGDSVKFYSITRLEFEKLNEY
ncbi:MAG TPA: 5-oxoprolinase subunit PxpB [Cyclobacteriaceae bacterium]|nr:5-oxoprolinase subunit PxpB [Cyclobacteriaceae bacterium]